MKYVEVTVVLSIPVDKFSDAAEPNVFPEDMPEEDIHEMIRSELTQDFMNEDFVKEAERLGGGAEIHFKFYDK